MQWLRASIAGGVRNPVLANLLMICILAGGVFSAGRLTREAFPEVSVDHVVVEMVYPGASPEDVERSICLPIEEALRGLEGVREISSGAQENLGTVWIGLQHGRRDVQRVVNEVKERVDQIQIFPAEAEKPIVKEAVIRAEVIQVAVYGDVPERTLKHVAREVRNDLLKYPDITQVSLAGVRDEEILIEVSDETLTAYNLTLEAVMAAVARGSLDLPAGVIRTEGEEVTLRVTGQRFTAAEYEDLVIIGHGDTIVRLGEIATVREGFEDVVVRGWFNGQPAALVSVFKTRAEDSIRIAELVHDYVASRQDQLPERLRLSVWGDSSVEIESRISMLLTNGFQGLVLLFLTLWLFLDLRLAFWVAVGIPVSFAGAMMFLDVTNQTINMISLFALIMVSGIIVDDSIVFAESVHSRREAGDPPDVASIEGTSRMALPVLGATLTSIVSFIPLLFVIGVMGRFIYVLPIVVIAALLASTVEGLWIQPTHLCYGQKPGEAYKPKPPGPIRSAIDRFVHYVITRLYRPVYCAALRNRAMTVAVVLALLLVTAGLWFGGRAPFVLIPKEDGSILRARVRFPEGSPVATTSTAIAQIESAAWKLNEDAQLQPASDEPLVRRVYSIAGEFADFYSQRGSNLCEVRIELLPSETRRIPDSRIIKRWREHIGTLYDATEFTIARQQIGPTDQPIEIRLLGESLEDLSAASRRVQERLLQFDGVISTHDDLIPGKREMRVTLKPSARALGLSLDDVARQLRHGFFGGEAVRVQRGSEEVKVRVRLPEDERRSIVDLETLRIAMPRGGEIPFLEVADVTWGRGHATIMHQDGKRRVRVRADIDERLANADQITRTLEAGFLDSLVREYYGMNWEFGGDREGLNESIGSLMGGYSLAMIVNFALLAIVLGSFLKPLVVLVAVPFGLIGVIFSHVMLGFDITMMSLFGIVGVSGLVVNEALVLVDTINWSLREGKSVQEAVQTAGELRFRPILLTTITDLAGLTPLLLNTSGQVQSVQPMAVALSFGLLTAALLNLLVVPVFFLMINDVRRFIRWIRYGGAYPTPESVEESVRSHPSAVPAGV